MSNGFDPAGEAAPGPDDVAAPSMQYAGEQSRGPGSEHSSHSGQDCGHGADMDDGCILPIMAQPASNAPTYRRSLFRR